MTHRSTVRPAMTALAAVIAMSSTALFAQSVTEPVVTTPAPVADTAPPPAAADPAPVAETPAAADPIAATPAKVTTTHKATTKATTVKTTAVHPRPAATHAAPAAATVAAAPAIAAPVAAPVAEAPVAQPLAPPTAIAAEPVAQPATTSLMSNDMLPIAGVGGLGLLLLAGTGLFVRSRRRRAQEAEDAAWQEDIETAAEPVAEPAMVAEPVMAAEQQPALELMEPAYIAPAPAPAAEAPAEIEGPVTDLPEGFDLSRFGYNVQQAYKGPTEDNPSLSLKHRLRRASGMDQQERKLDAEVEAATGEPVLAEADATAAAETPAAKPLTVRHTDGDFMFGSAGKKSKLSPTYTH